MKNINYLFLLVGLAIGFGFGFLAFAEEHTGEIISNHSEDENVNHLEDSPKVEAVNLSDEELKELNIRVNKVGSGSIESKLTLTGEIAIDPLKVIHLKPRYAGVVTNVYVNLGDNVTKGDTVAIIESNESLVEFPLVAPANGTVINIHMSPGEVKGNDDHAIEIADLNYVWAVMTLYQKDIAQVKIGQSVRLYDELSGYEFSGRINFISPIIDEATRTTTARIELKNSIHSWNPGLFVNADLLLKVEEVEITVSKNALQTYQGITVVFVKDKYGFRPQPVTVGKQDGNYAEILSGLHTGDIYVAEGAFTLKAELLKESFGGGHSH